MLLLMVDLVQISLTDTLIDKIYVVLGISTQRRNMMLMSTRSRGRSRKS